MDILRQQIRRAPGSSDSCCMLFAGRLSTCLFVSLLIAAAAVAVDDLEFAGRRPAVELELDRRRCGPGPAGGRPLDLLAAAKCDRGGHRNRSPFRAQGASLEQSGPDAGRTRERSGQALVSDAMDRIDRLDVSQASSCGPIAGRCCRCAGRCRLCAGAVRGRQGPRVDASPPRRPASRPSKSRNRPSRWKRNSKSAAAKPTSKASRTRPTCSRSSNKARRIWPRRSDLDRKQALVKLNDLAKEMESAPRQAGRRRKAQAAVQAAQGLAAGSGRQSRQGAQERRFQRSRQEDRTTEAASSPKTSWARRKKSSWPSKSTRCVKRSKSRPKPASKPSRNCKSKSSQARQAGRTDDAQKVQQQLDKLNQECEKCSKMSDLAKQLDQAAKGLKQGDAKAAQAALGKMSEQLQDMQQSSEEMAMLDQALDELAEAKNSMDCKNCNGQGCAQCQGKGQGQGTQETRPTRQRARQAGEARETGPSTRTKTSFYDSNVRQNVGKGGAVVTEQVEGPNRKGEVREEIKSSFESSKHEAADPLTGQRLPREYRRARQDLLRRDPRGAEVNLSLTPAPRPHGIRAGLTARRGAPNGGSLAVCPAPRPRRIRWPVWES